MTKQEFEQLNIELDASGLTLKSLWKTGDSQYINIIIGERSPIQRICQNQRINLFKLDRSSQ